MKRMTESHGDAQERVLTLEQRYGDPVLVWS
jgi:hypothetical protein